MADITQPLVSIITPCYNGEHCLFRLLDSILAQTYRPIEFVLVNDGSTDGTQALAESYIEKFSNKGISYTIVCQENKGLAGAINAGLKRFTGDYLCWPDADDYLEPTSVEDRVRVLEEHPAYAVVSSDAYIRDSKHLDTHKALVSSGRKYLDDPNQFIHHLNGDSIFCSGCHMVRASMFLEVNPDKEIYPARRGQNWQLLLPLYYKYKWIFLNKPLYNYIVFSNSMSHDEPTLGALLFRYDEHETILNETLKQIEQVQHSDMCVYYTFVQDKYAKLRMAAAIQHKDQELFKKEYVLKQQTTGIDKSDRLLYWRYKFPVFNKMLQSGARFVRKTVPPDPENAVNKLIRMIENGLWGGYSEATVSVLVPCYNAELYLDRCFDCLLKQSHKNLQILLMDDGSSDKSSELIQRAETQFTRAGMEFLHQYQENQGAAAAVNNLLPYVKGKYILLYDTDDILFSQSIIEQVFFLETHPDYTMVRTNGYVVNDLSKPGKELFIYKRRDLLKSDIFEDLVKGKTNNWPGSYMIRTDEFFKRTGGKIYVSRFGQNLQFMMPMSYKSKVGFVNKPLMAYYEHKESHSHSGGVEDLIKRGHGYAQNRIRILENMSIPTIEREKYIDTVRQNEQKIEIENRITGKKTMGSVISHNFRRVLNKVMRSYLIAKNERVFRRQNEISYWSEY